VKKYLFSYQNKTFCENAHAKRKPKWKRQAIQISLQDEMIEKIEVLSILNGIIWPNWNAMGNENENIFMNGI
jgi:hypothetical protein